MTSIRRSSAPWNLALCAAWVALALGGAGCRAAGSSKPGVASGTPNGDPAPAPAQQPSVPAPVPAAASPSPAPSDGPWEPQRPEFEKIANELVEGDNIYLGRGPIKKLLKTLEDPALPRIERIATLAQLAGKYLQQGEVDGAVARMDEAMALARAGGVDREGLSRLLRQRGLIYLRKAEVQNCVARHNADCCIFPLAGGGVHVQREPALEARATYEAYLKLKPDDADVVWLLNVVSMALGDHPQGVPAPYAIPASAFASEYDIGRFPDIAPALGLDTFNNAGGVVADDLDGDGLLDIVTSSFDPHAPLSYHRNRGDGTFEDRSTASRLDDQFGGLNIIGADYDNDGDIDILVPRGAWLHDYGQVRKSLLRNNGDGTFTDVTRQAGLTRSTRPSQTAVWGDLDNDGDLDLYIGNESEKEQWKGSSYPCELYRNNGDGTFTDIAEAAGVTNDRFAKGVAVGDYDNDGDLDLYVSNIGPNRLYRNDGGMKFTDVAAEAGVLQPDRRSFATWFFDYDNDGWLDLWVGGYESKPADIALDAMGQPHGGVLPCLYRNTHDGKFANVTREMGLAHAWLPMGANFGDLDNDGWLDFYLGTGDPEYETILPNVLLRNDGGRRFQNVTTAAGMGHLQKGHGIAFADFDNDGDQDVYHELGGFYPGDRFKNAFFLNPGHGNHYLTVKLVGKQTNTEAIGARLTLVLRTPHGERKLYRAAGSVASYGGSPSRQEIGLGDATGIARLEIDWPVSKSRQVFTDVPLDTMIRVVEGESTYGPLKAPRVDLARAAGIAPRR